MTVDDEMRIRYYEMILTEMQQKYQHYHPEKLLNVNFLQARNYYLLIKEE